MSRSARRKRRALISKTLKSAVANAENNANLRVDGLVVKEAIVGEGPTMKRLMTRARGSGSPIRKRTSHIRIILTDEIEIKTRERRRRWQESRDEEKHSHERPQRANGKQDRRSCRNQKPAISNQKFSSWDRKLIQLAFASAVNRDWRSRWYASPQELPEFLHSDLKIRNYVKKKLQFAAVAKIVIERAWNSIRVTIHTARPGIVIGRKGAEIEKMTEEISKMAQGKQIKIDIQEIKTPELDAQLVAENVALQIERRIAFRRAMKKAVQIAMDFGAQGIQLAQLRPAWTARKFPARNGIAKARSRSTPCARRSITASPKRTRFTGRSE